MQRWREEGCRDGSEGCRDGVKEGCRDGVKDAGMEGRMQGWLNFRGINLRLGRNSCSSLQTGLCQERQSLAVPDPQGSSLGEGCSSVATPGNKKQSLLSF